MNEKKKIAFVIGSLTQGGAERVVATLSNSLAKDFQVFIITLIDKPVFYKLNSRIKVISCQSKQYKPRNLFGSLYLYSHLVMQSFRILKKEDIDITIGFITSANIISAITSKLLRIPNIICERNNPMIENVSLPLRVLRNFIYPKTDLLVLQTHGIKNYYKTKLPIEKLKVLPNPISEEFTIARNCNTKRENIILNVGRLDKNKRQDLLIRAFGKTDNEAWKLIILGDGPFRSELEILITTLGLSDKVNLEGAVSDVSSYYNKAAIFAFTSITEGFPNALLEAMYFGLACISTDCPFGPSEVIENGKNGFLIPMNDSNTLQQRFQQLMDNENIRIDFGINAKATAKSFESKVVVNLWRNTIIDTLNNRWN